tara:strand:+ start:205 stop:435 length:231 start_codon:yes stop_codon:yes gene_type:complete
MEMVKLVKGDRVIERRKIDYDNNKKIWSIRGWKLDDGKPKAQPKVEPKPEPKPEPKADSEWQKEEPKAKKTTKKAE